MIEDQQRYAVIRNVTLVGIAGNILLSFFKLLFGWLGHSQALIADGLHSLSDLISDGVVLVAAKYSSQYADDDHPYGHARFETVATVIVGALLILVAVGILVDASARLIHPEQLSHPTVLSLVVIVVSLIIKELLYQYTVFIANQVRSDMLRANAWHHRSDAISSVIVLIGIIGSMLGLTQLDAIAAIGVSFMIVHIGWSLSVSGIQELVDTGLDQEKLTKIRATIRAVDGVKTFHGLRTRKMGSDALVDVHILVNSHISVSEGHQVGEKVRAELIRCLDEVIDVTVHVDPENDEETRLNLALPLRSEVINLLYQYWQNLTTHWQFDSLIERMTLHYLDGKLIVDLYLPVTTTEDMQATKHLTTQLNALVQKESAVKDIRVYFYIT